MTAERQCADRFQRFSIVFVRANCHLTARSAYMTARRCAPTPDDVTMMLGADFARYTDA
jgi:hypothetical protein